MDAFQSYRKKSKMCTDITWLYLFIICCSVMIVIAVYAIIYENYLAVTNGSDIFGNICGVKHNKRYENFSLSGMDTSSKPFVLYFDLIHLTSVSKICVEQCIAEDIRYPSQLYKYSKKTNSQICRYDFDIVEVLEYQMIDFFNRLGPCPLIMLLSSYPVRQKCVGLHAEKHLWRFYAFLDTINMMEMIFVYIYQARYYIVALNGFTLVISTTLLAMMYWLKRFFSWLICILVIAANVGLSALMWHIYNTMPVKIEKVDFDKESYTPLYHLLKDFVINKKVVYLLAILMSITTIVLVIVIIVFRSKICKLGVIFEEAASCLTHLPELKLVPLISVLILGAFFWCSVYVTLCMTTANYPKITQLIDLEEDSGTEISFADEFRSFQQVEYVESTSIRRLFWVYIVCFIWMTEFIFACEEFSIGAAVTCWYFERSAPSYSIRTLFKYHLGTLVKGSVAITSLKIPRLLLHNLCGRSKTGVEHSMFKSCNYTFRLLEKWTRGLNHNAYAVVAMNAIDFGSAAKIAGNTMARSTLQVKSINQAADFVFFLSKLFIATTTCLLGVTLLRDEKYMYFYMAPVILSTVFAFYIAHAVLALFEMIIDALFLCVCEDKQMYSCEGRWMQSNLAQFLHNNRTERGPIQVVNVRCIDGQPFRCSIPFGSP